MSTTVHTTDRAQRDTVIDLVHWFDTEYTSVHHALIMAAESNETSAKDPDVQKFPAVVGVLTESAARWRAIADRALEIGEKLGDTEQFVDANTQY